MAPNTTAHLGTPGHRLNDTLGALSNAAEMIALWQRSRDDYIAECAELGASYRRIAEYAGVSHQRVAQILAERAALS